MADLLDRLSGDVEPEALSPDNKISVHAFYGALVGLADGQITRAQIEAHFGIPTTGEQASQLTTIIAGYQAAADKGRYLTAAHGIFMLQESGIGLSKGAVNTWLTAAEAAY